MNTNGLERSEIQIDCIRLNEIIINTSKRFNEFPKPELHIWPKKTAILYFQNDYILLMHMINEFVTSML